MLLQIQNLHTPGDRMNILSPIVLSAFLLSSITPTAASGGPDALPRIDGWPFSSASGDTVVTWDSLGENLWPAAFNLFPDEGKIPNSEGFVAEKFLGHDFLRSAFTTRYDVKEYMFIIPADSAAGVRNMTESYLYALGLRADTTEAAILDVSDPTHGPVALLRYRRFFAGVVGARDRESSHWRLALLRTRLADLERAAVRVDLPRQWKVLMADEPRAAAPEFDDSGWRPMKVACYWETQGFERYDGVAWYRTATIVPSSLRRASIGDALLINLGRIDDNDSVYFNGVKVGHTESASTIRKYFVPFDLVHWDQPNTIAVRVDDIGGGGGLVAGPYYIKAAGTPDLVRIRAGEIPIEVDHTTPQPITRTVSLECLQPVTLTGTLGIRVIDQHTLSVLLDSTWQCPIGTDGQPSRSFALTIPGSGSYRARYFFVADASRDTVRESAVIAHWALPRRDSGPIGPVVGPAVVDKAVTMPDDSIRLGGYLEERIRVNLHQRLLNIDEAGVLSGYLERPGNQDWVNEYVGKYLHAASLTWEYSKDPVLKAQMDRMVDVLLTCQKEDGYLGTYLPENYWLSWDVWGHKYNLIGLLSYYKATGFVPALDASRRMGDLLCRTFGKGPGKINIVKSGAWFGLASCSVLDPMVELYAMTGDRKYLDFCQYIIDAYEQSDGPQVVSKLLANGRVNTIGGGKAYELLSNLLGLVKLYRIIGDERLLKAAESAWTDITQSRLYVTGSASSYEIFQEEDVLPGGSEAFICEGCVTTEWLHFNEELFRVTGEPRFMDAIETTIYNHLLAAENPLTGGVSYYTPLEGKRNFRTDIHGNCCLASVPRGIAVIPEVVYTRRSENGFSINIYSAGRAECTVRTRDGKDVGVRCEVVTRYPESGNVRISVDPRTSARFVVGLRVPSWCKRFTATVAGKSYSARPGTYVTIDRTWRKGSVIIVECDLTMRVLDGGKSYGNYIAVQRGPQVLAMDAGLNPEVKTSARIRINARAARLKADARTVPGGWSGTQRYTLAARDDQGGPVEIVLVPFADAGQKGDSVRVWMNKE